ncbi:MAG: DUF642 domain-containing protein [Verrucomicrobiota bacterium]
MVRLSAAFGFILTNLHCAWAADPRLDLLWDPSPDPDVKSYQVYYGEAETSLTNRVQVTGATTARLLGLTPGKTYHIQATAVTEDGLESEPSNLIRYNFSAVNTAPQLATIANQIVLEGGNVSLQLSATDTDVPAQTLSFRVVSGPTGAAVSATGLFTWKPSASDVGKTNQVTIAVSDSGAPSLTDQKTFQVSVTPLPKITNTAPVLVAVDTQRWSTATATINNGSFETGFTGWSASGNVIASTLGAADGAQAAIFNCGQTAPNGRLVQDFATTAGRTYTLSYSVGVIAYNQSEQRLQITVEGAIKGWTKTVSLRGTGSGNCTWQSDSMSFVAGGSSAKLIFDDVSPTTADLDLLLDKVRLSEQVAPVTVPVFSVTAGSSLNLALTATDGQDAPTALTFSLVSGPSGATVSASGAFAWTPSASTPAGANQVTVQVKDAGQPALTDVKSFTIQVLAAPTAPTSPPQAIVTNTAPVLVSVNGQNWQGGASGTTQMINGSFESGLSSWTASGNLWVSSLGATDGGNAATFNAGQTTPNGRLSQSFATVIGRTYTISFDAGIIAYNQNEQRLRASVQGASTSTSKTLSLRGTGNGTCNWQSDAISFTAAGTSATILFEDISPTTADLDLLLDKVRLSEQAPAVVQPTFSVTAGSTLILPLSATDAQDPASSLTFSLLAGPSGASVSSSGVFGWTPSSAASASTNQITVQVKDQGQPAMTDSKTFVVEVNPAPVVVQPPPPPPVVSNNAPVLVSVDGQSWQTGGTVTARFNNGSFESGLNDWTASGNVMASSLGASDGSNAAAFNVGQTTPNGKLTQSLATVAGRTYTVTFDAGIIAYNQNEQSLRLSIQGATSATSKTVTLRGNGNGSRVWQSDSLSFVAAGASVTVIFEDVSTTSADLDMLLDQVRISEQGTAAASTPSFSVTAGGSLSLQLVASDDQDQASALVFSLVSGPTGATVSSRGLFSWTTATTAGSGSTEVTVKVTDQGQPALSDSKTFTVKVTAAATPPPANPANRILNGSFEAAFLGWSVSGNASLNPGAATDGIQGVSFNGGQSTPNARLSQGFATVTGRSYTVTFNAGIVAWNQSEQRLRASIQGATTPVSQTTSLRGSGGGNRTWQPVSFSFTAAGTLTTLLFEDISPTSADLDLLLDNVRVMEQTSSVTLASLPLATEDDVDQSSPQAAPAQIVASSVDGESVRLTFQIAPTEQALQVRWTQDIGSNHWQEVPAHWATFQSGGLCEIRVPLEVGADHAFFRFDPAPDAPSRF